MAPVQAPLRALLELLRGPGPVLEPCEPMVAAFHSDAAPEALRAVLDAA